MIVDKSFMFLLGMRAYSLKQACALGKPIGHYKPLPAWKVICNTLLWKITGLLGVTLSFDWIELKRKSRTIIDIEESKEFELNDAELEEKAFVEQPLIPTVPPVSGSANLRYYLDLAKTYGHCH